MSSLYAGWFAVECMEQIDPQTLSIPQALPKLKPFLSSVRVPFGSPSLAGF